MNEHRLEVRVRYAETDRMGMVYYANFFVWFEIGRVEWLRAHGVPYRRMEDEGFLLPVRSASCVYHRPARYDDLLQVRTQVVDLRTSRIVFATAVYHAERGELLADGETTLVCLERERQRTDPSLQQSKCCASGSSIEDWVGGAS